MIRRRIPKKKRSERITKHKIVRLPNVHLHTRNYPKQIHIEESLPPRREIIISGEERAYNKLKKYNIKNGDRDYNRSNSQDSNTEEPARPTSSERVNERWRYLCNKVWNREYESLDAKIIIKDVHCNSVNQIKSTRGDVILRHNKEARNPVLYLLKRQASKLKCFEDIMSRNKDTGMDFIDNADSEDESSGTYDNQVWDVVPTVPPPDNSQRIYVGACRRYACVPSRMIMAGLLQSKLCVIDQPISTKEVKVLAVSLVHNGHVRHLDLHGSSIEVIGLRHILEMLTANITITELNIANNKFGKSGAAHLAEFMKTNKSLRKLDISGNLGDRDADYIASIIKCNSCLTTLVSCNNHLDEYAGRAIGAAISHDAKLEQLDLSWNSLRYLGAMALCRGMKRNTGIRSLNLSWNGLGLQGCYEMGKSLEQNKTMIELDISANRICLDAFRHILAGLLQNKTLKILRIGLNPITTEGATAILKSVADDKLSSLLELDMTDVFVDKEFVNLLHEIQRKRNLLVKYGVPLRQDKITIEEKTAVFDTDDPATVLFEYLKQNNFRLIDLLHSFDKDRTETLSRDELRNGLMNFGIPLSTRAMDLLMTKLDRNKDGTVDYEELVIWLRSHTRKLSKLKMKSELTMTPDRDRLDELRDNIRTRLGKGPRHHGLQESGRARSFPK